MNNKQKTLIWMLKEYPKVLVLLDPRVEGVVVPEYLKESLPLGVDLGLHLPIPIRDLEMNSEGFSVTLSFNREPHHVTIPWDSVFGMVNHENEGPLWPDFLPEELADQFPFSLETDDQEEERPSRPSLGVLDGGKKNSTEDGNIDRPSLTLVK